MNETLFFPNLVYIDPSYEIKEHVISFSIYHRLLKVTQISTSSQNMNDGEYFHPKHRIYLLWPKTEERRMLPTYILINGMEEKSPEQAACACHFSPGAELGSLRFMEGFSRPRKQIWEQIYCTCSLVLVGLEAEMIQT